MVRTKTPEQRARRAAYIRAYRIRRPEVALAAEARYRETHPEAMIQKKAHLEAIVRTPEQLKAKRARYRAAHKERLRVHELRRRRRQRASKLDPRLLYRAVQAAIPLSVPRHVREDAMQSILLAVFDGEIDPSHVAAGARRFLGKAWGLMDGAGAHRSIDDLIPGTDGLKLGDTFASDREHF